MKPTDRPDMLRADYLAAIGAPRFPHLEHGGACGHDPLHVVRVDDPRPGAAPGAKVRVWLDCPTVPMTGRES